MANQSLAAVKATAMDLPEDERAELAHDLVASLDGTPDPGAIDQWDAELLRRLAEVKAGTAELHSRAEFRERLKERLQRR
ncbi:MAG: addiction module component CHP02574 family protein [Gammaproteobacteria bacterium]|nr:addiction module component CHP02574 family protein [Gammaproteobacteria bacterium]